VDRKSEEREYKYREARRERMERDDGEEGWSGPMERRSGEGGLRVK
jgi:hypothetical protein